MKRFTQNHYKEEATHNGKDTAKRKDVQGIDRDNQRTKKREFLMSEIIQKGTELMLQELV
jgi:hypothetical protein